MSEESLGRASTTATGAMGRREELGDARKKAISLARHGRDEPRAPPVVLQLYAEVADVAIDQVALRDVVGPPERVEDHLAIERLSGVRRQQVEQRLFDRRQVKDGRAGLGVLIEQVELEPPDVYDRHERHGAAVGASHERKRARDELLGTDRHGDEVVGALLEGPELGLEVTALREHDRGYRPSADDAPDKLRRIALDEVDVDDEEVRLELPFELTRLGDARRRLARVHAVVQGEAYDVGERCIGDDEHARRSFQRSALSDSDPSQL